MFLYITEKTDLALSLSLSLSLSRPCVLEVVHLPSVSMTSERAPPSQSSIMIQRSLPRKKPSTKFVMFSCCCVVSILSSSANWLISSWVREQKRGWWEGTEGNQSSAGELGECGTGECLRPCEMGGCIWTKEANQHRRTLVCRLTSLAAAASPSALPITLFTVP